jgi:hypothetical protein
MRLIDEVYHAADLPPRGAVDLTASHRQDHSLTCSSAAIRCYSTLGPFPL